MHALGSSLVWLCTLIVALPLSPCAFFASACCQHEAALETALLAEPVKPCCAQHSAPQHGTPVKQPADNSQPCQSECCRLSPFVPVAEKVLLDAQPELFAGVAVEIVSLPVGPLALPSAPLAEAPPLRILHCQWRL